MARHTTVAANTNARVFGRLIDQVEAVTLDSNVIDAEFREVAAEQDGLEVTKIANQQTPEDGDAVVSTITATNLGSVDVTGGVIYDELPEG